MTYEQKQAIKKLLQERQAMQAERREQAIIDREDEEIFQLFHNRGKVDPSDTTRSSIFIPALVKEEQPVNAQYESISDITIYRSTIPWDRIIVGMVYAGSLLMAIVMVLGWLL